MTVLCVLAAIVLTPAPTAHDAHWRWPLHSPVEIVRGFDPPAHPWDPGHRGVDLAARPGRRVYAAGPGRIGFAGEVAGRGVVTVDHGAVRTTYLPVHPAVRRGRRVSAGDLIGTVEEPSGHCGTVSCLHWGLIRGDRYLDPLGLLGRGPVRLLPFWATKGGTANEYAAAPPSPHATGRTPTTRPAVSPSPDAPGDAAAGRTPAPMRHTAATTASGTTAVALLALVAGLARRRGRYRRPRDRRR